MGAKTLDPIRRGRWIMCTRCEIELEPHELGRHLCDECIYELEHHRMRCVDMEDGCWMRSHDYGASDLEELEKLRHRERCRKKYLRKKRNKQLRSGLNARV